MSDKELQIESRIKKVMSNVFNVSAQLIDGKSSPRTIETWKGRNHLKMVEKLEKEFGIEIEPDEIETLVSYKVVRATVMAYLS